MLEILQSIDAGLGIPALEAFALIGGHIDKVAASQI
jgi:hypothetical protein